MNEKNPQMRRDALLRRALVPKGFRPNRIEDIEKMLRAIGQEPMTDEKLQRMLRKVEGQEPIFPESDAEPPIDSSELSAEEKELVAHYRAHNTPLPPDLANKVKAMEDRAAQRRPIDEPGNGG